MQIQDENHGGNNCTLIALSFLSFPLSQMIHQGVWDVLPFLDQDPSSFSFLMVFGICLSFCMHSKCMRFGIFKCAHFDELILLMHQRLNKRIQWGHLPSCTSCRSDCVECRDEYCILWTKFWSNGKNQLIFLLGFVDPASFQLNQHGFIPFEKILNVLKVSQI